MVLSEGVEVGSSGGTSVAVHQVVNPVLPKVAYVLSPNSLVTLAKGNKEGRERRTVRGILARH